MSEDKKKKPVSKKSRLSRQFNDRFPSLVLRTWHSLKTVIQKGPKKLDFRKFEKGKKTQFFLNVAAGLLIVFIMQGLESTRWGEGMLDNAFDWFIRTEANKAIQTNGEPGDILFLDIEHNKKNDKKGKVENQKTTFLSPRHTIAGLIKMAFDGRASVIVLDISFEENDCCHPERDEQLRNVLAENKNNRTIVIFPVRVGRDSKLKKIIFDEQIDNSPNYFRAISTFYASQSDSVVRHWKAFQKYGNYEILWSIPVLAVALHKGKMSELKKIEPEMIQKDKTISVYSIELDRETNKKLLLPLDDVDLYLQRIRYQLIPKDCMKAFPEGNIRLPTIEHLTSKRFKDKIVIIGNSDPKVGDVFLTPVGNMPGMFIQGNSIQTVLKGLQPKRAPLLFFILMDIFIIVFAVYLFHYLDTFLADLLWMVSSLFILGYIAFFIIFRNYGFFPNFVFGIVAIDYVEIINSLKDFIIKKTGKSRR